MSEQQDVLSPPRRRRHGRESGGRTCCYHQEARGQEVNVLNYGAGAASTTDGSTWYTTQNFR